MEVLPHLKTEFDARHDSALVALDQAASSCEQAAQRLRAITAGPFSRLDFEAEHPEWSFSRHSTSSGPVSSLKSTPKAQPCLRPSTSSTECSEGGRKRRGRHRKLRPPEQERSERKDAKRTTGEYGRLYGNSRQGFSQSRSNSESTSWNKAKNSLVSVRSSAATYDAYGLSDPPSPSKAAEPKEVMQVQARTVDEVEAAIVMLNHDVHSSPLESKEDSLISMYQKFVNPVIQSLTHDYEAIYPGLNGPALCEEVYSYTMRTLPPDLLQGNQSKRRKKTLRRFAKEVWGQKIVEHTSKLRSSGTSTSEHSKSDVDSGSLPQFQSISSHDLSSLGPGEMHVTSSESARNHRTPYETSTSQLESVGLSPEPENNSGGDREYDNAVQLNKGLDRNSIRTQDVMLTTRKSGDHREWLDRDGLGSSSNQISTHPEHLDKMYTKRQDNYTSEMNHSIARAPSESWAVKLDVSANDAAEYVSLETIHPTATVSFPYRGTGASKTCFNVEGINTVNVEKARCETGKLAERSESTRNAFLTPAGQPTITALDQFEENIVADSIEVQKPNKEAMRQPEYHRYDHRYRRLVSRKGLRRESNAIITVINWELDPPPLKTTSLLESSNQATIIDNGSLLQFRGRDHSTSDPSLERALGALSSSSTLEKRPFKPATDFNAKYDLTSGTIQHVDFTNLECEELLCIICQVKGIGRDLTKPSRDQLRSEASSLSRENIDEVAHQAYTASKHLTQRKRKAIRRFLRRLKEDDTLEVKIPSFVRVESSKIHNDSTLAISTLLRQRTYGLHHEASTTQRQLRSVIIDNLMPKQSWKGASGDIVSVAWNPNSQTYAVGATATSNPEDLQYNRENNLLYGNVNMNTLHELPDHRIDRPKPNTIVAGPNSSEAVYEACDPKVYKTVSAIQFSTQGSQLFTASHDSTVKIWDTKDDGLPCCSETLYHEANVDNLEVSLRLPKTFATGTHTTGQSIRVYTEATLQAPYKYVNYGSSRAQAKPRHGIYPECLRWGTTSMTEHLLLAGFARWGELPNNDPGQDGELCIWDINTGQRIKKVPSSQSVFTAEFHPFLDAFATGGAPGTAPLTHQYATRTVVRIWDMRNPSPHWKMELECPALDMQDIKFHPRNANIVAAGCTDGAIYVWDIRKPDYVLHKLQHGEPITDWDNRYGGLSREQGDAGVTMTLWGSRMGHLFTGATDGTVKCWDINHAPEDALIRNVAQLPAGVSCGSFSPDSVSLLVGDSTGGIHLLSSDPGFPCPKGSEDKDEDSTPKTFEFVPAPREYVPPPEDAPGEGQLAALEALRSGQLVVDRDFGVGQGPAYAGPYATYAHLGPPSSTDLLEDIDEAQPMKDGHIRDNEAARTIRATISRRREELNGGRETTDPLYCGTQAMHLNDYHSHSTNPSTKRRLGGRTEDPITAPNKRIRLTAPLVIDLTSDCEDDVIYEDTIKIEDNMDMETTAPCLDDGADCVDGLEDDYWFPYMDLDLFAKLNLGP